MKPEELRSMVGALVTLRFVLSAYRDRIVTMHGTLSLVDGPDPDHAEVNMPYKYHVGISGANTYWLHEDTDISCEVFE